MGVSERRCSFDGSAWKRGHNSFGYVKGPLVHGKYLQVVFYLGFLSSSPNSEEGKIFRMVFCERSTIFFGQPSKTQLI